MKSLVSYSESDSSEEEAVRLPLPLTLGEAKQEEDNPDLHGGRQRSVKHERGIWATFIHVSVPCSDLLSQIQARLKERAPKVDLKAIEEPHISLSKLLILRHHWIEEFVRGLKRISGTQKSFHLTDLDTVEVYCNDEKTRTFVGLKTDDERLVEMVAKIEPVLQDFKLPGYYEDLSFHCSIAWALGDRTEELQSLKKELQVAVDDIFAQEEGFLDVPVNEIFCKCGNRLYKFEFS